MGEEARTECPGNQEQNIPFGQNKKFRTRDYVGIMAKIFLMPHHPPEEKVWKEMVFQRFQELLDDMGWDEKAFVANLAPKTGNTEKAVEKYFERRSIPIYALMHTAALLGIDITYLLMATSDKAASIDPNGQYALHKAAQDRIRQLEEENMSLRAGTRRSKKVAP